MHGDDATLPAPDATAPGTPAGQPETGMHLGRFVLGERIGHGGMGVVYEATDPDLDRRVAIKLLHPALASSAPRVDAFSREAKSLARIAHPNVVTVHEVGQVEDRVFIAMELVEGESLGRAIEGWREAQGPLAQLLDWFVQAGRGLEAAHREGLVHRDFKPENVLIGKDGRVRVTDFGIAALDADTGDTDSTGEEGGPPRVTLGIGGTPGYMAPEQ